MERRKFIKNVAGASAGIAGLSSLQGIPEAMASSNAATGLSGESWFKISLAQWSLHISMPSWLDPINFPLIAKREFGIQALEYVNQFFFDKARDTIFLKELKQKCTDEDVVSLLIMVDREGNLGDPDTEKRETAVGNHHKWVEAAAFLGCHSIRVNARSQGEYDEQMKLAADGLRQLCEYGEKFEINVIVENHGGLSSNGKWLTGVMEMVDHPRCGILPDFGNFRISSEEEYDRYQGVKEFMPYAKGVSAKSNNFDENGDETRTDYYKMLKIVKEAGYTGYIGIEYEGRNLTEFQGIRATKKLLEKAGAMV